MVTQCAENPATAGSDEVDIAEADESQQAGFIRQQVIEQLMRQIMPLRRRVSP
jgi:hypothetical protein